MWATSGKMESSPAVLLAKPGRLVDQSELGLDAPICLTWELTYAYNLACDPRCGRTSGSSSTTPPRTTPA
jgi:hypothetical protein